PLAGPALAALVTLVTPTGHAGAFPLRGCALTVTSLDASGTALDTARDGEATGNQAISAEPEGGTADDPLRIAWNGALQWAAAGDEEPIESGQLRLAVFGIPLPAVDLASGASMDLGEAVPFRYTGLYYLSGQLRSGERVCAGSGWVLVVGEPAGTVPFLVALLLAVLGIVLLATAVRGEWLAAALGGPLLGLGGAVLMVLYATLPFGEATPWMVIGVGMLLGAVAGYGGRRRRARPAA
ncbi:MAG TPA: hypothetical protein VHK28_10590, partial [Candidatus Limnocylindria bacterium]|nr:hypothetical protein [Candidatus Limnocylindria bacterium]